MNYMGRLNKDGLCRTVGTSDFSLALLAHPASYSVSIGFPFQSKVAGAEFKLDLYDLEWGRVANSC